MAELAIKMTSDDQQVAQAVQRLEGNVKKVDEAIQRSMATSQQAAREAVQAAQAQSRHASEGERLAQNLIRKNETLEERYRRQRTLINEAHRDGKLGAEQHAKAVDLLNKEIAESAEATRTKARAERDLDAAQNKTTGPTAMEAVGKMAAGYLTWASAARVARVAIADVRTEMEKGRSQTDRLQESRRNLLQVSAGDFSKMESRADVAASQFGVQRDVAREVLFNARSEGFEKDFEAILAMSRLIDPKAASRVAGQTNTLFGGKMTSEQILSGMFVGAGESRLNFSQMAEQIPIASEGAALASAGPEETIAALSVLASQFNNAGDRIKALASKIGIDDRTRGRGLIGGVEALQAMSETDRKEFLGKDQETNAAYMRFVEQMDLIKTRQAAITAEIAVAGTEGSLINQRLAEADKDPKARAFLTAEKLKIANEITSERQYSERQSNLQGLRALNQLKQQTGQQSGAETFLINRVLDFMSIGPGSLKEGASQKIEEELTQQTQLLTEMLNRQAGNPAPAGIPITRPGEDK